MRKFIAILLTCATLFSSCKKDKETQPPAEIFYKLKSITDLTSGKVWKYEYDTQNRCTKEWTGNNQSRREYTYSTGSVKEDEYSSTGNLTNTVVYDLNGDGLAVKANFPGSPGYYTSYTFNTNKQRLKYLQYDPGGLPNNSAFHYYTGELLDSIISFNAAGVLTMKSVYQYYADVKSNITNQHRGLSGAFGNQSSLAIKTLNNYFYNPITGLPQGTQAYAYTYESDTEGRIIKSIVSGAASGASTYTYY